MTLLSMWEDRGGQQPVAPMAGGMPALEFLEGLVKTDFLYICMRLTAGQVAQAAHHALCPVLHGALAQREAHRKEFGPEVSEHRSFLLVQVSRGLCQPHLKAAGTSQQVWPLARGRVWSLSLLSKGDARAGSRR
jgi:hypothetical protein